MFSNFRNREKIRHQRRNTIKTLKILAPAAGFLLTFIFNEYCQVTPRPTVFCNFVAVKTTTLGRLITPLLEVKFPLSRGVYLVQIPKKFPHFLRLKFAVYQSISLQIYTLSLCLQYVFHNYVAQVLFVYNYIVFLYDYGNES